MNLKPFLTYKEQTELLRSRGIIVSGVEQAEAILSRVSYYRLINAYGLSLIDKSTDRYKEGTTLENIYNLYQFDAELRAIVLRLAENFEVLFKTRFAYHLGEKYGALGYMDEKNFLPSEAGRHQDFIKGFEDIIKTDKSNLIISHHRNKYNSKVPIWAASEILTFGMVSRMYGIMKLEVKKVIADSLRVGSRRLEGWLHSFVVARNICAHYGRLYNRRLPSRPSLYKGMNFPNDRIFAVIILLLRFIEEEPACALWSNVFNVVDCYPEVELERIGFPEDWKEIIKSH